VGVALAVDVDPWPTCTHVATPCETWGPGNPLVEGFCCLRVGTANSARACTSGDTAATVIPELTFCGRLHEIIESECDSNHSPWGCGGHRADSACTNSGCGAS
jgi:hypothetical protein